MAERRMFAKTIIDSDAFLDMPVSAQALYFHLCMRADDDGFLNNPKKIQRLVGAADDDLKLLLMKRFILAFESGVIVIKHWKIHNYLRNDRYKPTMYQEELQSLRVKENKAYTDKPEPLVYQLDTVGIPDGYQVPTSGIPSIGKDRKGKESLGKVNNNKARSRFVPPTEEEVEAYCRSRNNTVDAEAFVAYYKSNGWKVGKNPMQSWQDAVISWEKQERAGGRERKPKYGAQRITDVDSTELDEAREKIRGGRKP